MDQAVKANPLVSADRTPEFSLTADYCQLHCLETSIIPQGLELGWHSQLDWDLLRF
ncbi:hypothetical protein VP01_2788g3 [Puccinia sorghi]|uniref:Uncharacterized protein n=1 Tax=Puccinia sorghi TaxID=27349 RepID=A0A0L6V3D8_9BASI|nr:hypothetical protein VP01_2788g3 [Puccinia sorghi]